MKKELKSRLALTGFFQETLVELTKKRSKLDSRENVKVMIFYERESRVVCDCDQFLMLFFMFVFVFLCRDEATAEEVMNFIKLAKRGEELDPTIVVKVARSFKDELTLDNMSRFFVSF